MKVEPGTSNVVIVAHQFNPSVVNQLWLVDNGIVARDEFLEGCVFSDMVVNVNAKDFSLFVSPEQLQFVPKLPHGAEVNVVQEILGKFVKAVPHTPFSGLGLNFVWIASEDDIVALTRRLFFRSGEPLYQAFDSADARFGAYMSRDFRGGRMKLDIKPVTLKLLETGQSVDRLQFAFNFHFDILPGSAGAELICEHLTNWIAAGSAAKDIIEIIGGAL